MALMNVEGVTREMVASHLQKYRSYLARLHLQSAQAEGLQAGEAAGWAEAGEEGADED